MDGTFVKCSEKIRLLTANNKTLGAVSYAKSQKPF